MSSKEQNQKFKSKWFRIATAGDTTDGREIQENWIQEIAETYNPQTYGARINVEHIRSVLPDSSFGAYGNVIAVKPKRSMSTVKRNLLYLPKLNQMTI